MHEANFSEDAPPTPDAVLPALDADQLEALRGVGSEWSQGSNGTNTSLPVDPSLGRQAEPSESTRSGRFVHVEPAGGSPDQLEATLDESGEGVDARTVGRRIRRAVLGPPLKSTAIVQERMRKLIALPVLSADALSSVAYGPEAMLAVLVLAGGPGLGWSLPVSGAIAFLMLAVGLSYRQTIRAYPHGGGSYIVASANLGRVPGLVAAAGLITDYVLTVAVSVSSGLAAVTSAVPSLQPAVVPIGVALIAFLLAANLRGVRQAGAVFAAPTYAFILAIALLVVVGLLDAGHRSFHPLPAPVLHASQGVGLLLVLRAFASGSTAMTGIEAISNAVPAFKPVEWRNARTTLTWMIALLISMFVGIVLLVHLDGIVPESRQTVLSQLAHLDFGSGPLYVYTQAATALVLLLAADTAYNDFPRVMFLLARDRFAPRPFLKMGDRLAFNNGIAFLSIVATLVFVAFSGNTSSLIPLYAVGVFLAFTLSQAGMVVHWWRLRGARWRTGIAINAVGCAMSAIVFLIAAVTKFTAGAWVSLLIVVAFTAVALLTRRHFDRVADAIALSVTRPRDGESEETPAEVSNLTIVPVAHLDRVSVRALAYAASLGQPVLALHVSPTEEESERFCQYWSAWGNHVPLELIQSPYRVAIPPTVAYIE
ncbi:MAG: APC family permease, partial [Solirubrobacterales bacterium]|nr:APC family permease [Solirubrobacterales bacterium]